MTSKKLTTEEIRFLKTVAERILVPLHTKVTFPSTPMIIHTFVGAGGGPMVSDGDEYVYHVVFEAPGKGARESTFVFYDTPLAGWAWHIAFDAFMKLDGNMDSATAENLWPRANGLLPDYEKFIKNDGDAK